MLERARAAAASGDYAGAIKYCRKVLKREKTNARALFLAGNCAMQAGRHADAVKWLTEASRVQPGSPEIWNNLGAARLNAGDAAGAIKAIGEALRLRSGYANGHVNMAAALRAAGRLTEAGDHLRKALEIGGNDAALLGELGDVLVLAGQHAAAADAYGEARNLAPEDDKTAGKHIRALAHGGAPDQAEETGIAAGGGSEGRAERLTGFAEILDDGGFSRYAARILRQVVKETPDFFTAWTQLDMIYGRAVKRWHFNMLNDTERNEAYDGAIRRLVRPGDIVLDIGAGSGLLAMMAVRAGAEHVYSCEGNGLIADKARDIVATNGMAERITIIDKWSKDIEIGRELPRRADVLISEIVDNVLIGEGIIPSLKHAYAELVKPDARVIPAGGAIHIMPVEAERVRQMGRVTEAAGFDVSQFNEFGRYGHFAYNSRIGDITGLARSRTAFRFDLTHQLQHAEADTATVDFEVESGGMLHGVVAWLELQLDDEITLTVAPEGDSIHWLPTCFMCDPPRPVKKGEKITVTAHHDTANLHLKIE